MLLLNRLEASTGFLLSNWPQTCNERVWSRGARPRAQRCSPRRADGFDAARQAVPTAALLPPNCREAGVHAALVCAGASPVYYQPGWGPCSLCWGWFWAGALAAGLAAVLLWLRAAGGRGRSPPPAWAEAAAELLGCMSADGEEELATLARATGQSPAELLCHVLREAAAPHASSLPALPPAPALPRGARRRTPRVAPNAARPLR